MGNRLYHYNPWTDTTYGACPSFDYFCHHPVNFFLQRFTGMTRPVAELLANKVFCILDDPSNDSARMGARDFGAWAKDLPSLLGGQTKLVHKRVASSSSSQYHPIASSVPASHRPSSRNTSRCCTPVIWTPTLRARSLSRAPSGAPAYDTELSTVVDQESFIEEQDERKVYVDLMYIPDMEPNSDVESTNSRPASSHKRRKRGARKGKNPQTPTSPKDETLTTLANASQSLAREVSRASRSSSMKTSASGRSWRDGEPPSMYAIPNALLSPPPPVPPLPIAKKPSKWKLSFGKSNSTDKPHSSPVGEILSLPMYSQVPAEARGSPKMSTAANVENLIRGLDAPQPKRNADSGKRRRRPRDGQMYNPDSAWIQPSEQTSTPSTNDESWPPGVDPHSVSPASMRTSRQQPASSASSTHSNNWRSSMSTTSSAMTSTSAFTRYSNSSVRSVSTAATSVSSSSWRTHNKPASSSSPDDPPPIPIPKNVKSEFISFSLSSKMMLNRHAR
jgi:hypothetical protein